MLVPYPTSLIMNQNCTHCRHFVKVGEGNNPAIYMCDINATMRKIDLIAEGLLCPDYIERAKND